MIHPEAPVHEGGGPAAARRLGPWLLALAGASAVLFVTLRYAQQPLLDHEPWRETQTALTTFWFLREGWRLDYQTPVLGYGWSIPP